MAKKLLPDALWTEIAPLFPAAVPRPKGGRPRVENREALLGILFVLYTGIPWERLPFEVAGCSGTTCWRRLRTWQDAGLWDQIHHHMLQRLGLTGEIDWSRVSVDASSVPAKKGATRPARTPPTAASRAPNDTWWSTAQACRSPLS